MYRMSLITMLAPPSIVSGLDIGRCIKMCLIHDMAESLVGDITPVDGVPKVEKNRREASTMDYITKTLLGNVSGGSAGHDIRNIWQEYEDSKTPESLFVHDVDKLELLLQMVEYEKRGRVLSISENLHTWPRKWCCLKRKNGQNKFFENVTSSGTHADIFVERKVLAVAFLQATPQNKMPIMTKATNPRVETSDGTKVLFYRDDLPPSKESLVDGDYLI